MIWCNWILVGLGITFTIIGIVGVISFIGMVVIISYSMLKSPKDKEKK